MRSILSATLAAILFAACGASQPTPAEDAAIARTALSTLMLTCARLPDDVDARVAAACARLADVNGVVTSVCPEPYSAGAGGR